MDNDIVVTDFDFLSLPTFFPPATQPQPHDSGSQLPLDYPLYPPPPITYSAGYTQDAFACDNPEWPTAMEITPAEPHILHSNDFSTPGHSDSDMAYPPSSAVHSELNSAAASESDFPSAVVSEPDLLSVVASEPDLPSVVASDPELLAPPRIKQPRLQTQSGIHNFFRVLSEDEAQAMRAKRKRADSTGEFDPVEHWNRKQEKKLIQKRERDRIHQQNHRLKLKKIEIRDGVRDSDGELIKVSQSLSVCFI
jgi:hypothetical protein